MTESSEQHVRLVWEKKKNKKRKRTHSQAKTRQRSVAVSGEEERGEWTNGGGCRVTRQPDFTWPLTRQIAVNQRESAH